MSLQTHEFMKFIFEHDMVKTPSGKITYRKRKIDYGGSITRMPSRLKLMHDFMRYIHEYGYLDLLHEKLAAKEKRRCAMAKKRVVSKRRVA